MKGRRSGTFYLAVATIAGCVAPVVAQLPIHVPPTVYGDGAKAPARAAPKAAPKAAPTAGPQGARRAAPPVKAAPPIDYRLSLPVEEYKLANGLRVILSRDNAVPVISMCVMYAAGIRYEDQGHAGYAHLFEHLMKDGAASVGAGEFSKYAETAGGHANGSAMSDYAAYTTTVPANYLTPALWLEAGRMGHLALDPDSVKTQVDAIAAERQRIFEQQGYSAEMGDAWPKLIFSNKQNARSFIGERDDLKGATAEEAAKYFHQWYSPSNAVLVLAGDFQTVEVKKTIDQYFGVIAGSPPPAKTDISEPPRTQGKNMYAGDPRAGVPAVILGWPAPARHSPEWNALKILDALLTDGPTGTLNANLVEGRRSLLQVQSGIGWPLEQTDGAGDPSEYAIFAFFRPGLRAQSIPGEIQLEIDGVGIRGVDDNDLRRVKAALRARTITRLQSSLERASLLASYAAVDGDLSWIDKDMVTLMQVTGPQVQVVARRLLAAARRDTLIIENPPRQAPQRQAGPPRPAAPNPNPAK